MTGGTPARKSLLISPTLSLGGYQASESVQENKPFVRSTREEWKRLGEKAEDGETQEIQQVNQDRKTTGNKRVISQSDGSSIFEGGNKSSANSGALNKTNAQSNSLPPPVIRLNNQNPQYAPPTEQLPSNQPQIQLTAPPVSKI